MKKIKIKPQKLFNIAITYLIILAVCFVFLFPILFPLSYSLAGACIIFKDRLDILVRRFLSY